MYDCMYLHTYIYIYIYSISILSSTYQPSTKTSQELRFLRLNEVDIHGTFWEEGWIRYPHLLGRVITSFHMGVEPKIGVFSPKMDGENNGKPKDKMDDLGIPWFFGNTYINDFAHLTAGTGVLRLCHFRKTSLHLEDGCDFFLARSMKPAWNPAWNEVANVCIWPLVYKFTLSTSWLSVANDGVLSFPFQGFTLSFRHPLLGAAVLKWHSLKSLLESTIFLHEGQRTFCNSHKVVYRGYDLYTCFRDDVDFFSGTLVLLWFGIPVDR